MKLVKVHCVVCGNHYVVEEDLLERRLEIFGFGCDFCFDHWFEAAWRKLVS